MLNRISKLSRETIRGGHSAVDIDAGPLDALTESAETVQYVLASTGAIEHRSDGETRRVQPGSDHEAYAVVTDASVYFVIGDAPTTPELTVAMETLTRTSFDDGLLRTRLSFQTTDGTISFSPTDTQKASAVATYVDRIGSSWADLDEALTGARASLDAMKDAVESDGDVTRYRQQARTRISKAHHCATHEDDAPSEQMQARIEPLEAHLDALTVASQTEQIEARLDEARQAHEEGALADAVATIVETDERLAAAQDAVDDGPVVERLAAVRSTHEALAADVLDEAETRCHDALAAEDPATAVAAWTDALDRYRAALSAGWDGQAGVSADALDFQLAWVVQHCIDALSDQAAARTADGDDLGETHEDARDCYEDALDALQRATALADEHPHATADTFEERIDQTAEKAERAQWQWGRPQ